MMGPFDSVFGDSAFDLDRDGHIDAGEWSLINDTLFTDQSSSDDFDDDDELEDELEFSGISRDEFEMMDDDERRSALEDAGLDPDDFDDLDDF